MHRAGLAGLVIAFCPLSAQDQHTFDFESNFWVNLHHFLYEQAISKPPEPSDSRSESRFESNDWQRALNAYRDDIAKHELLSRDIAGINSALARIIEPQPLKSAGLDAELTDILERAAPVYR